MEPYFCIRTLIACTFTLLCIYFLFINSANKFKFFDLYNFANLNKSSLFKFKSSSSSILKLSNRRAVNSDKLETTGKEYSLSHIVFSGVAIKYEQPPSTSSFIPKGKKRSC